MNEITLIENGDLLDLLVPDSIAKRVEEDSEFREEFCADLERKMLEFYQQKVLSGFAKELSELFESQEPKNTP